MHCLALGLSLCYFQRFTFSVFLITRDCWLRYRPHPTLRDCVKCAPVWTARSWSTQVIREGLYRLWLADQYTLTLSHTHSHTHTHTHTLTHTHTHTDTNAHSHTLSLSHTHTYSHILTLIQTHLFHISAILLVMPRFSKQCP